MTLLKQFQAHWLEQVRREFVDKRSVLSFWDYLDLVVARPQWHLRNAAQYFTDVIDFFGTSKVKNPSGEATHYKFFDAAYDGGIGQVMGHEKVAESLVRLIRNFVRAGRIDRLIMLHGPNGSAKTSIIQALSRAAEVYSHEPDGAIYKFNWVFPAKKGQKGGIGFSATSEESSESFAYLPDEEIEARIPCDLKDHPLFLMPIDARDVFFKQLAETTNGIDNAAMAQWLKNGDLSPRNRKIFNALLTAYHGDLSKVLRHVQVERFYFSRRYRTAVSCVEPQMSVDAHVRQITADQSLAALPSALHHLALLETSGALVDGNRGLVEFNDLLKRPIESWKYLLVATEQAQASVDLVTLFLDTLMIASSNELHLRGFRDYPDWQSFKGRIELVRVPYLLRFTDELHIYQNHVPRALNQIHIAPHSLELAARFAVLTRLEPPRPDRYPAELRELINGLTPIEKLELYDSGKVPSRLSQKDGKELRRLIVQMNREYDDDAEYEGLFGASPREVRTLLLNAAQDPRFDHLSPVAVLNEISKLIREKSSYEFLRRDPVKGYRDPSAFLTQITAHYLVCVEEEIGSAMGFLTKDSQRQHFERYVRHVSAWTKKEKMANPATGKMVDPDAEFMNQTERAWIAQGESAEDFRRSLIAQIGAFRLDHPEQDVDYELLFGSYLARLKDDYFVGQRKIISHLENCYLRILEGDANGIDEKDKAQVQLLRRNLLQIGYNDASAKQAIAFLVKSRL